jgi:hypothetical protein
MDSPLTIRALVILVLDAGAVTPGEGAIHSAIASLGRDRLIEEAHVEHHASGGRPRRFWRWTEAGRAADLEIRQILVDFCAIPLGSEAGSTGGSDPGSSPDQILARPPATADLAGRPD